MFAWEAFRLPATIAKTRRGAAATTTRRHERRAFGSAWSRRDAQLTNATYDRHVQLHLDDCCILVRIRAHCPAMSVNQGRQGGRRAAARRLPWTNAFPARRPRRRIGVLDRGARSSLSVTSTIAPESAISTRARSMTVRSTGAHGDGRDATVCTDLVDVQVGLGEYGLTTAAIGQPGDVALVAARAGSGSAGALLTDGANAVETLATSGNIAFAALVGCGSRAMAVGEQLIGGLTGLPPATSAIATMMTVLSDGDNDIGYVNKEYQSEACTCRRNRTGSYQFGRTVGIVAGGAARPRVMTEARRRARGRQDDSRRPGFGAASFSSCQYATSVADPMRKRVVDVLYLCPRVLGKYLATTPSTSLTTATARTPAMSSPAILPQAASAERCWRCDQPIYKYNARTSRISLCNIGLFEVDTSEPGLRDLGDGP